MLGQYLWDFLGVGRFLIPIKVLMILDKSSYKLGDTIKMTLELNTRREKEISGGRIELTCEERWADTWTRYDSMGRIGGVVSRGTDLQGPLVPKTVVKQFKSKFVHSMVSFMENTSLQPKSKTFYKTELAILNEMPPHAVGGKLSWNLVTILHTVDGKNVQYSMPVVLETS